MTAMQLLELAGEWVGISRPKAKPDSAKEIGLWDLLSEDQLKRAMNSDGDDALLSSRYKRRRG